ncbi:MAG: hypothetical protein AAF329_25880 [Cyanobacteria bacterium P01_A01_bin.17]
MRITTRCIGLTVGAILSGMTASPAVGQAQPYPSVVVETYLAACSKDSRVPQSYCECTIRELQRTMSFGDYMKFSLALQQNPKTPSPTALTSAVAACLPINDQQAPLDKGRSTFSRRPSSAYPPIAVQAFIDGCERSGEAPLGFCQCSIDEVQKQMSFDAFVRWIFQEQQEVSAPPLAFQKSVLVCALKHGKPQREQAPRRQLPSV